jgi:hypothetical protein
MSAHQLSERRFIAPHSEASKQITVRRLIRVLSGDKTAKVVQPTDGRPVGHWGSALQGTDGHIDCCAINASAAQAFLPVLRLAQARMPVPPIQMIHWLRSSQ